MTAIIVIYFIIENHIPDEYDTTNLSDKRKSCFNDSPDEFPIQQQMDRICSPYVPVQRNFDTGDQRTDPSAGLN